jgi:hypothetical protein
MISSGRKQPSFTGARGRKPARVARIGRSRHLVVHVGEVDDHAVAIDGDLDLDAQRLVEAASVIVEKALGLIDPVGHLRDEGARLALGLIPDGVDASLDRFRPVAFCQLAEAADAETA